MRKLILFAYCATAVWAQPINTTASAARPVSALPTTCNPSIGSIVALTTGIKGLYSCTGTNTWTWIGSGGGGGSTTWGLITGTLSNQGDLNTALGLRALTSTTITATSPLTGGGSLAANRTIGCPTASTSLSGCLSSTDWNTFNGKQAALTNPVTGTGTSGTLGKFTGTSTIGNAASSDVISLFSGGSGCTGTNLLAADGTCRTAGGGGGGTGNAAEVVSVAFSATPTFTCGSNSAGTVSTFTVGALTGNITSSTLATCTTGQLLNFVFVQDGTGGRTVAMPTNFDPAPISPTASKTTTLTYFYDGTNGRLINSSNDTQSILFFTERAAPGIPASGSAYLWPDSTNHVLSYKANNSSTVSNTVVPDTGTANNYISAISAAGVITKSRPACATLSDSSGGCSMSTTAGGDLSGTLPSPSLANIPSNVAMAGSLLATAIVSPSTPASGKGSIYVDSTSKNIAVKDDAGVVKHGVQTDTGTANNYISAISDAGAITKSRPACATLSDSAGGCSMSTTAGGDLSGTLPSPTVAKVNGATVPVSAPFVGTNSSSQIVLASPFATNAQTSTYQVLAADFTGYKTITVASGTFTITLVASGSQPASGQTITVINYGSGVVTIARSGQNINGGTSSLTLAAASATAPTSATITSDGSNYFARLGGSSSNTTVTRGVGFRFVTTDGSAISGTQTSCRYVPYSGTITGWHIDSDTSGSGTFGVKTVAFASYTGLSGYSGYTDMVGGGTTPSISSGTEAVFANLTSWTTSFSAGLEWCVQLTSPSTTNAINLTLDVTTP